MNSKHKTIDICDRCSTKGLLRSAYDITGKHTSSGSWCFDCEEEHYKEKAERKRDKKIADLPDRIAKVEDKHIRGILKDLFKLLSK